jgi:hypothetical protein
METGETDKGLETKGEPFGLLLRWDGFEVQWAWMSKINDFVNYSFGSREVNQPSMLPEVIRALKSRYGTLETVLYARRFSPVTMLPAIVLEGSDESASMWFNFHNAVALESSSSDKKSLLRKQHLESVEGEPVFLEKTDENWEFAVINSFPQARGIVNRAADMKLAVADSRQNAGKWVIRVDVGKRGADFVAASEGKAVWSGYSEEGNVEGMLYDIVNVMHRDGKGPEDLIIRIAGAGAVELKSSLSRFFKDIHIFGDSDFEGLKSLSV